ncbi:hypothetical protein RRG08_005996 [Elysia crispata]|uniref:Uncharacterized protein n=1 Tax=Elysia crispata TaxID=231223 RepID=A0AAE0XVT4_9GAST|nr:hypothetical protein RRG08_005996 [Elysia crispata]
MRLLVAIVLLVSWSVTGSLSLSVGTIISPSSLLDDGALISPSSVSVSHLMKLKQKKHTSYGALHLLSIKPTDSAPAEQDNVASQSSVKTKATQELGNPTSDLFDKDPRTGPTKEESHTVYVTPSPSFVLSYFKQLTKLSKDPTHAQLLEKILPQKNQVETLKSREKREVNDSNAGNDDDHDEDTDGVTRASSRMAQSLLSKVFHSRTLTPSLPTRTLTTLPAGRAARLSGRTRATQPRTQSASGVTQTQQKTTPVGLSRRHRSTVSYTQSRTQSASGVTQTQQKTTPVGLSCRHRSTVSHTQSRTQSASGVTQTQQKTTPVGLSRRHRSTVSYTQPRTQSASGVTQTQQKTTPVGLSRRHRSTVSYTQSRTQSASGVAQTQQKTTPVGLSRRHRSTMSYTQPRTQSASGVTQTQQKTTPVGLSRRHRSTVSYTRRCPQLSELKAIMVQVSRYSKDEIRNMIRCLDLRQRRLRARTTTTTSTTAPRRCRSRTDDVADAKARDLLTVG